MLPRPGSTHNRQPIWRWLARLICRVQLAVLALIVTGGPLLFLTRERWLPAVGAWLEHPAQVEPVDAVVVLGGGGPRRALYGVRLYQSGVADELWFTGDAPPDEAHFINPAEWSQALAEEEGVDPASIHRLRSNSTVEDAAAVYRQAQANGAESLLIVSDWYHGRRAMCLLRREFEGQDVALYFSPSPSGGSTSSDWWLYEESTASVVNEYLKFGFHWWHHGLAPWHC